MSRIKKTTTTSKVEKGKAKYILLERNLDVQDNLVFPLDSRVRRSAEEFVQYIEDEGLISDDWCVYKIEKVGIIRRTKHHLEVSK